MSDDELDEGTKEMLKEVFHVPYKESSEKRLKANLKLVEIIKTYAKKYPDLRFSQILANWDFVIRHEDFVQSVWIDEYNVEPDVILERVKVSIKRIAKANK